MSKIYKYPLSIINEYKIPLHSGARPIHVGLDPQGSPSIWVEVEPDEPISWLQLRVVGTGQQPPDRRTGWQYLGSFIMDVFMWHVYYR